MARSAGLLRRGASRRWAYDAGVTSPARTARTHGGPPAHPRLFDLVVGLFCSLLLISNVGATKLIAFGPDWVVGGFPVLPIVTDGGALLFPLTYVFGDLLAEVYGWRRARRAILLGFGVGFLASVTFLLVDLAPPAADYENADAFHAVLGFVPRIVAASLVGYLAGQLVNAQVVVRLKNRARPGSLWWRLVSSTLAGELVDTALFCTIAFGGIVSLGTLGNYIVVGYVYKVLVEVVLLPVTLRVIAWLKRYEGAA